MDRLAQLEACARDLAAAAKVLTQYRPSERVPGEGAAETGPPPLIPPNAPDEARRARRTVMATQLKLQMLTQEPADFLQQLAAQNQLLACLNWLGQFQVLACIPQSGSVPFEDVADLAGVPEAQLRRVVQMIATAGFLHEPQPGHVAHTYLSAQFVTKPAFLDAGMFLSETMAPAALQMAGATRRSEPSQRSPESAYNVAFDTRTRFASECEQYPKLQRQWHAYQQYGIGDVDASIKEALRRLDWSSLGHAMIVDVGAPSARLAESLAGQYPALRFIVQLNEPMPSSQQSPHSTSNRWPRTPPHPLGWSARPARENGHPHSPLRSGITVQHRSVGTLQTVRDAVVYLIRVPPATPEISSDSLLARISAELKAHLGVLRANSSATLVLAAHLLPEPGTLGPDIEATARLRDLSIGQLANERELESSEVTEIINTSRDSVGRLVLINKLQSRNSASVAFEIRYRADTDYSGSSTTSSAPFLQ